MTLTNILQTDDGRKMIAQRSVDLYQVFNEEI